jgi:hypothetical protein
MRILWLVWWGTISGDVSQESGTKPAMQFIECRQNFEIENNVLQEGVTLIMWGADGPCLTGKTKNQVYLIFHSTR